MKLTRVKAMAVATTMMVAAFGSTNAFAEGENADVVLNSNGNETSTVTISTTIGQDVIQATFPSTITAGNDGIVVVTDISKDDYTRAIADKDVTISVKGSNNEEDKIKLYKGTSNDSVDCTIGFANDNNIEASTVIAGSTIYASDVTKTLKTQLASKAPSAGDYSGTATVSIAVAAPVNEQ